MISMFEQAKQLHEAGDLAEAEALYREAAEKEPESFKAFNNLGTVLEEQGRFDEAISAYRQGVEIQPDCFLLHYNLGHALHRAERLSEAFLVYVRAVQLEPESFETHYNLGNLLMEQGRYESAASAYRRSLEFCESKEIYSNLGSALFEQKQLSEAVECYRKAIEICPDDASEHFHLGRALEGLASAEGAIASYEESIRLNPQSSVTHAHLIMLLQGLHREHATEAAFEKWKAAMPGDPVAEHMWASYSKQDVPARASDSYVQAIFDRFATDFDAVLSGLNYRAPQIILQALSSVIESPAGNMSVLDAGCGTGLCGPLVKPYASQLVGVDLSLGMLEKARLRECYDELSQCEITKHMSDSEATYDLIVAADTLIYFGELEDLCKAAAASLRDGGVFVFTIESLDSDASARDYEIGSHGRYSHAIEYVGLTLQRAGFIVKSTAAESIRTEATQPVAGYVVLATKG